MVDGPLSPAAQERLAEMRMITADDDVKKRIDSIFDAQKKYEETLAAAQEAQAAADKTLAEAKALTADMADREAAVQAEKGQLATEWGIVNSEKAEFSKVREASDAALMEREGLVQDREGKATFREADLGKREAAVSDREISAKNQLALYGIAHTNLRAALDANKVILPIAVATEPVVIDDPSPAQPESELGPQEDVAQPEVLPTLEEVTSGPVEPADPAEA